MELKKNEIQTLRHLFYYKILSVIFMGLGVLGVAFGIYANFLKHPTDEQFYMNNALIGAALVVLGISYVVFYLIHLIGKLKSWLESAGMLK